MKIEKSNLEKALKIVKPGLSGSGLIEQSSSFAFMEGRVITYNDEISVSHPVEGIEFDGAVDAEELYGILMKLTRSEVSITQEEETIKVKCGAVVAKLKISDLDSPGKKGIKHAIEDQKILSTTSSKKWKTIENPEEFIKHLTFATHACSSDMTNIIFTCVFVRSDGVIYSTDRYRFIKCKGSPSPVKDFLLPASSVSEITKIKPSKALLKDGWIHFQNDEGTVVSSRVVDSTYLAEEKLEEIMNTKGKNKFEFPAKIEEMISRARVFAKREYEFDEVISISINNNELEIQAKSDTTKSSIKEKAKVEYDGTIEFFITPSLFQNILKQNRTCIIDKNMKKLKFESDDKSWLYVAGLKEPKIASK